MTCTVRHPSQKIQNFKDLARAIQPRTARISTLKVAPKPEERAVRPAEFFLSNRWRFS